MASQALLDQHELGGSTVNVNIKAEPKSSPRGADQGTLACGREAVEYLKTGMDIAARIGSEHDHLLPALRRL